MRNLARTWGERAEPPHWVEGVCSMLCVQWLFYGLMGFKIKPKCLVFVFPTGQLKHFPGSFSLKSHFVAGE